MSGWAHDFNGANGMSDMAGKSAREAVEPSGRERNTMLLAIIEPAHSLR